MFALIQITASGHGDNYLFLRELMAVSAVPAKLIFHATETIEGWGQDNETGNWYYGDKRMPNYRIERILELK